MRKILIYGAGQYAKELYYLLEAKGYTDRIEGFIVSSGGNKGRTLFERPVFNFSEYDWNCSNNLEVYIAIATRNATEVQIALRKIGINDFIQITPDYIKTEYHAIYCANTKHAIDRNKVFFDAFNGLGYRCNCKYIAEELHRRDANISIVWNLAKKSNNDLPKYIRYVKQGSPDYFQELYTSNVVIYNNPFACPYIEKRKEQYYVFTWHGIGPFKKVAYELVKDESIILDLPEADVMLAGSSHCERVYRQSFRYEGEIMKCGYPRNDVFFNENNFRGKVCSAFGISEDSIIVMYAPTFRYNMNASSGESEISSKYDLDFEKIIFSIENRFQKKVALLLRLHHRLFDIVSINKFYEKYYDATFYPDMQELLVATDILITDYSSSMWDFSLTGKPVFLYFNDKEECENRTGFYRDPDTYPYYKGHTTEELCRAIREFDNVKYQRDLNEWFMTYKSYDDGHASERVVDRIIDVIKYPMKYGRTNG